MNLTSENFAILLRIEDALTALSNTSLFVSTEALQEHHNQVIAGLNSLSTAYPAAAQKVKEYYDEETEYPQFEQDEEETLFRLILNLRVLAESETIRDVSYAINETREFLTQFASLFEDFDSEYHFC